MSPRITPTRPPHGATWAAALAGSALAASGAGAQPAPAQAPEIVTIYGDAGKPLTRVTDDASASPASVTVIDRRELDRKTINTYGDILRGVTGFSVLEYGQGLVAYDVQARGFDGGHGRNVAVFLDGMPLNVTGSQHTNGYADLAQLIPELLDRVEIVRGPFSVLAGNHAVGGSIQYTTDAHRESSIKASVDAFGRVRVLPIASVAAGPGQLLMALDLTKGPGYTDQSDLERSNLFTRYGLPLGNGLLSARVQVYHAKADAPGYIDRDRVESGAIGDKAALSKGIGDGKTQHNFVINYRSDDAEGAGGLGTGWVASLYFNDDARKRWTNYDLSTPPGSSVTLGQERDQLHQAGLDLRKNSLFRLGGWPSQWLAGVQVNREHIDALNLLTDADHNALTPTAGLPDVRSVDRRVQTNTQALYGELQTLPMPALKLTAGLRYDHIRMAVTLHPDDDTAAAALAAGQPLSLGQSMSQFSPKLGAALALADTRAERVELFANVARGLKSPYAFSDLYGNVGIGGTPDLSLSPLRSAEAGAQGRHGEGRWSWRVAYWNTRQDRETDRNTAGVVESFKRTRRDGLDLEAQWSATAQTRLRAGANLLKARIQDPVTPGADHIPNVVERSAMLGVDSAVPLGAAPLSLGLAVNFVGPQAITADNTQRARAYQRITARAAYPMAGLHDAVVSLNVVGYTRRYEEAAFDFGTGQVGISPQPRLRSTLAVNVPL